MKSNINVDGIKHIAFIMDGNGRWAKSRNMPRQNGHIKGAKVFKEITEYCYEVGINCLTFYAFSTENWKRPSDEVNALLKLISLYLDDAVKNFYDKDIRFVFIGDKRSFPSLLTEKMNKIESDTAGNRRRLNVAINYGGREEIVHAVNTLIKEGKSEICEDDITSHLYTLDAPMPDLIVRTGGEKRLSNYLLWQSAYSELVFVDKLWPDMKPSDIDDCINEFNKRQRRFGGV